MCWESSSKLFDDNVFCERSDRVCTGRAGFSAAILKAVNQLIMDLPEKISSLHHAILYLVLTMFISLYWKIL